MWTVISVCFVIAMAVLGITEVLRRFWLFLMRPKDTPAAIMVIKLKKDVAVQQLRYAMEFLSWEKSGDFSAVGFIATDLDENEFREVKKIADSRKDVFLCDDFKIN